MLVAVSGGTGFVGTAFCRELLRRGCTLRLHVNRRSPSVEAETLSGDLADPACWSRLIDKADCIIHAAGAIGAPNRESYFRVNEGSSAALAKALQGGSKASRVILISSLAARHPEVSDYAASKRAGEEALRAEYPETAIIRPPAVYGPEDRALAPFFRAARAGWALQPADRGRNRLSLIHVDDLARLIADWTTGAGPAGELIEPDDGKDGGYAWAEFHQTLSAAIGRQTRPLTIPRSVLAALALVPNRLGLTPGKVRELFHPDWVCRAGLPDASGWRPRIPLTEGLKEVAKQYS